MARFYNSGEKTEVVTRRLHLHYNRKSFFLQMET